MTDFATLNSGLYCIHCILFRI